MQLLVEWKSWNSSIRQSLLFRAADLASVNLAARHDGGLTCRGWRCPTAPDLHWPPQPTTDRRLSIQRNPYLWRSKRIHQHLTMIFRSHVIRRCAVSCLFPPSSCLLRGHLILSFVLFGIPLYVVSFVLYLLLPVPPFTFLHLIWSPVAFCYSTIFFVVCFKETSSSKKELLSPLLLPCS